MSPDPLPAADELERIVDRLDRAEAALARFAARAADPALAEHHREAARHVTPEGLAEMYDRIEAVRLARPDALTIKTRAGEEDEATLAEAAATQITAILAGFILTVSGRRDSALR